MFSDPHKYKRPELSDSSLSEDYIIRIIGQAVAALAEILGLKTAGQYQQAQRLIDQNLEIVLGLEARLVRQLDDHSLLDALTRAGKLDIDRLGVVADLFKEDGDIQRAQNYIEESYSSYLRALNLELELALDDKLPPTEESRQIIGELWNYLADADLSIDILYTAFCYFDDSGQYALAAAVLDKMEAFDEAWEEIHSESIAFYERLLSKNDQELAASNFTMAQISQKLLELKRQA